MKRRAFIKIGLITTGLGTSIITGLACPSLLFADTASREAFSAKTGKEIINTLFNGETAQPAESVKIDMPIQADGHAVPVKVTADLNNIETIAIITENPDTPLASMASLSGQISGYSTRIRVASSSTVTVLVKANGKLYTASQFIKINRGGYGMGR